MAETLLDQPGDVGTPPGRDAVTLGVRAAQDQRAQGRKLPLRQPRRTPAWPVAQAIDTLGIVADHGIAQGLALHARQTRRFGSRLAFQGMSDG